MSAPPPKKSNNTAGCCESGARTTTESSPRTQSGRLGKPQLDPTRTRQDGSPQIHLRPASECPGESNAAVVPAETVSPTKTSAKTTPPEGTNRPTPPARPV